MRVQLIDRGWVVVALALAGCSPNGGVVFEQTGSDGGSTSAASPTSGGGEESGGAGSVSGLPPPPSTLPTTTPGSDDSSGGDGGDGDSGGTQPPTGTVIPAHGKWRWLAAGQAPADWAARAFEDGGWPEGQAPFGEGGDAATIVDPGAAAAGMFARARFEAAGPVDRLALYLRRGDGAVVYINGTEVLRTNLPDGALAAAEDDLGGDEVLRYLQFVVPGAAVQAGENVVAVAVRRAQAGAAGLTFDMQVDVHDAAAAPQVKAQWRTRTYGGEYSDKNIGAAWIETEAGGFVRTLIVWGEVRRDNLVAWNAKSDGDVVDAVTSATRGSHRTNAVSWDLRDANGQTVGAGSYLLQFEFTEDDSNKGADPGPRLAVPFVVGAGDSVTVMKSGNYRDVSVLAP